MFYDQIKKGFKFSGIHLWGPHFMTICYSLWQIIVKQNRNINNTFSSSAKRHT